MIETERLFLRKIVQADIDLIYEINNDPECIRFNSWDSMSLEKCKAVIDGWIDKYKENNHIGVFCVQHKESTEKIGMAYIIGYRTMGQFEIGFRLRSSQWNKGYAKEITRGFIKHAGDNLDAYEIIAEVFAANDRSRNIFEKLGFEISVHPDGEEGILYRYGGERCQGKEIWGMIQRRCE